MSSESLSQMISSFNSSSLFEDSLFSCICLFEFFAIVVVLTIICRVCMSIRQTEKRTVVIRIGKGITIVRKTMSHCASVTRRKKRKA